MNIEHREGGKFYVFEFILCIRANTSSDRCISHSIGGGQTFQQKRPVHFKLLFAHPQNYNRFGPDLVSTISFILHRLPHIYGAHDRIDCGLYVLVSLSKYIIHTPYWIYTSERVSGSEKVTENRPSLFSGFRGGQAHINNWKRFRI